MASSECFLTEEQREMLAQSAEVLSTSPLSPSKLMSEHFVKAPVGGKAVNAGIGSRHVRRTHSGKLGRAKKGNCLLVNYFSCSLYFGYMSGLGS